MTRGEGRRAAGRFGRVPGARALLAAVAATCGAAGDARAADPVTLAWDAPGDCPTADAVLEEVHRLLGRRPTSTDRRVEAAGRVVVEGGAGFWLELRTRSDGAPPGTRELRAGTCAELADAAALIIALAYDPAAVAASGNDAELAPVIPVPIPPQTAPVPPPAEPTAQPPLAAAPPPSVPPFTPRPRSPWPRPGVGLGVRADVGSFPALAPALAAWGSLQMARLRLELGVAFWPLQEATLPERPSAGGRFSLGAGELGLCHAIAPWDRQARAAPLELDGCAGLELGQIRAVGFGVSAPGEGEALWVAPRAGASLRIALPAGLGARIELGAAFPLGRTRFVLERVGLVHEPGAVVGRGGIGLERRF